MCEGTFAPTGRAAWLSRAQHLQNVPSPVTVRFSDFSGVPSVPDGDPTASPRGMAIRFHLPSGVSTDLIAQSYKGFPGFERRRRANAHGAGQFSGNPPSGQAVRNGAQADTRQFRN